MSDPDKPNEDDTLLHDDEEFADALPERQRTGHRNIPWSQLVNGATLRALLALVLGVVLLAGGRDEDTTRLVVSLALIGSAVSIVVTRGRSGDMSGIGWGLAALQVLFGFLILLAPDVTLEHVAWAIAAVVGFRGIVRIVRGILQDADDLDRSWQVLSGLLFVLAGTLLALFPTTVLLTAVFTIGVLWLFQGIVSAARVISGQAEPEIEVTEGDEEEEALRRHLTELDATETWRVAIGWLQSRERDDAGRHQLTDKLFYEGPRRRPRLQRFGVLMFLSVVIATLGVIQDSTAVVIGAMLIAPLMTLLMGTSVALILGWPRRAGMSATVVVVAVLGSILLALILSAWIVQVPETVLSNGEITSRVKPTLVDLLIALAAGAAGAFALSRPDVSDSLPGVAVAIALVPPLAVVGITLQAGAFEMARGAGLLFLTNAVAILLAGSFVFVLLGVAPLARIRQQRRLIRVSFAVVGIAALVIVLPLALTGENVVADQYAARTSEDAATEWVGDRPLEVIDVEVEGDVVSVTVAGQDEPPPAEQLADDLADRLDHDVDLVLRLVPVFTEETSARSSQASS